MGFRRREGTTGTKAEEKKVESKLPASKAKASSGGSGGKTYHNNALTILESKDGSFYVQISKNSKVEIMIDGKVVTGMISKDPMVELEESVAAGRLTEERAEEIASKIPEYIKANVTLVTE